ncbi:hypothetical protein ACFE04_024662 [Oxalis oulophora]
MMNNNNKHPQSSLPPGFRFHPTDEELILHYLMKKVSSTPFPLSIIADVDIYKFDPWDLPAKAAFGEKEWYFFTPRDRKYPNGARPNRAAGSGYWKATGTDKIIVTPPSMTMGHQENIGVKKALVFYKGRPPKGMKTNWIMHEYRLAENSSYTYTHNKPFKSKDFSMRLDDWVLCRIYKKSQSASLTTITEAASDQELEEEKFIQDILLPTLKTPPSNNTLMTHKSSSFSNLLDAMDYSLLGSFLSDNQTNNYESSEQDQPCLSNYANMNSYDYLDRKLPRLISTPTPDNKLKRHHVPDDDLWHPSKKLVNSCSSNQADVSEYKFFNQQLLLSPHLQFHG